MTRNYRLLFIALLTLLVLPLAAQAAPAQPDTVILAFSRQPDYLLPDYAVTSTAGFAMRVIYESLVAPGAEGEFEPRLAESWSVSEDQLTWTFNLRHDVTWHDGEPFTANDVAFSFTFPADPTYTGGFASVVLPLQGAQAYHDGTADSISGINVIDDYTIALTTDVPSALFLAVQGGRLILPRHAFDGIAVADYATSDLARQPVGTGPYRVVEWVADESITYEAYSGYWGTPAIIPNYVWRIIPERSVQVTELLGGTVDIVPEVTADDFPSLQGVDGISTLQLPGVNFTYAVFNQRIPFFSDVRVRQAVNYAVDVQSIIDAVGGGFGQAVTTIVHPSLPEYNPNLAGYPYNPETASALLAEAGWTDDDGDGVVESHGVAGLDDGTPFRVRFGTLAFSPYDLSAQIVQQNLAAVGIAADLETIEFNIYFSEYLTADSDFELAISGWFAFEQQPQGELETNFGRDSALNWGHWPSTDEFEDIIATAPTVFDPAERNALYFRAQEIVGDDAVWLNLARLDNLIAHKSDLIVPEVGSLSELFSSVAQWSWAG